MSRMKIWAWLLEGAGNCHLFLPGGRDYLVEWWRWPWSGLSLHTAVYQMSRCYKTINPSMAWDAHICHGKWHPSSVNTVVFHQPSACRIGWCIVRYAFSVIAHWAISGEKKMTRSGSVNEMFQRQRWFWKVGPHSPLWLYLALIKLPVFQLCKSMKSIRISRRSYFLKAKIGLSWWRQWISSLSREWTRGGCRDGGEKEICSAIN